MMRHDNDYAVAVRKSDGSIAVTKEVSKGALKGGKIKKIPFIRGCFNFVDSMVLGVTCIGVSASYYDDGDAKETKFDKAFNNLFKENAEKVLMGITVAIAIVIAVAVFMMLPYFLSQFLNTYVRNQSLLAIIEGVIRLLIFFGYVSLISMMRDMKRLYAYHGAEHKCINCIESGKELNVKNAMRSSRLHKRCGTSFLLFVMIISVLMFMFIRVDNPLQRILLRLVLVPVIAGISYELVKWAGRSESIIVRVLSAPGMLLQRITTREPDKEMVETAIAAVEAVFDWRGYLQKEFGDGQK